MVGRADKGLIITTGGFTREARREATRAERRVRDSADTGRPLVWSRPARGAGAEGGVPGAARRAEGHAKGAACYQGKEQD